MKEIGTIAVGRLNNGAHFLYVSNVLARAEADTKVSEKAAAQVSALKTAVAQEDRDLKLSQKSLLTDDIAQADHDRDQLYIGYKQAVKGFLNLPVENLAQAAKVLNQHIIDYAIDPQEQLDKETGMLVNFLADLEGKYAEQVSALSLTPFVTALKEANERVRTFTADRTEERMTQTVGALKNSRKASDEAYRALVKWVNALALIEGETEYADFIDYVNTEITHYKREVIGQKSKAPDTSAGQGGASGDSDNDDDKPGQSGGGDDDGKDEPVTPPDDDPSGETHTGGCHPRTAGGIPPSHAETRETNPQNPTVETRRATSPQTASQRQGAQDKHAAPRRDAACHVSPSRQATPRRERQTRRTPCRDAACHVSASRQATPRRARQTRKNLVETRRATSPQTARPSQLPISFGNLTCRDARMRLYNFSSNSRYAPRIPNGKRRGAPRLYKPPGNRRDARDKPTEPS